MSSYRRLKGCFRQAQIIACERTVLYKSSSLNLQAHTVGQETGWTELRCSLFSTSSTKMMRGLTLVLLLVFVGMSSCQMFQYSRGWKPGKRADIESIAQPPMLGLLVRCLQAINAWEGLHLAGDALEVGRAASHFLDVLEHCQMKEGYWSAAAAATS